MRPVAATSLAFSALFVLGGTVYPVFATGTKFNTAIAGPTLDGLVVLRSGRADDVAAIEWLRRAHPNSSVVEAVGDDYSDAGRFSTFAGLSTLVGWTGHEVQWRGASAAVEQRKDLARRVYTSSDVASWRDDLRGAGMRFIVVGNLERDVYGPTAGASLDQTLPVAQQFGSTTVFELTGQSR